jgi:SAM-dependent MidA family methyltransferase
MSTSRLDEIIRGEITRTGPITFARFMELALYHPSLGYYSGGEEGREPLGWGGDFFTSGDVHPLWGEAIARQLYQMWQLLECPSRFDIIEPGGGRGLLARDIWLFALERKPEWIGALRYTIVDRTPPESPLGQARQKRLQTQLSALNLPDDAVHMVDGFGAAGYLPEHFTGCIVSNELVDALPTHVLEKRGDALAEVFVTVDMPSNQLVETLDAPSSMQLAGYLDHYGIRWRQFPDAWRCEACPAAGSWLAEVTAKLGQGYVLTIDYGSTAEQLYTPDRRRGTLAVYVRHQINDHPLSRPGQQDITAHVNFTGLIEAGRNAGLDTIGMTTQGEFLSKLGIRQAAEDMADQLYPYANTERHTDRGQADYLRRRSLMAAVGALLDPGGLGSFRVLVQQRGVLPARWDLLGLDGTALP